MGLPNPIPDNPLKWDGWKRFDSANPYERLCLDTAGQPPSNAQIEEHCRLLLMWWQKKLPLKSQPSNPMAQMLRAGLDEASAKLSDARSQLLDPARRKEIDAQLLSQAREGALAEFYKFLTFALTGGTLNPSQEERLLVTGEKLGLSREEAQGLVDTEIARTGARRLADTPPVAAPVATPPPAPEPPPTPASAAASEPTAGRATASPQEEFLRMLRLSGVDEMTDDQRDAFCNMGEALGLTGGQAEDVIDDYLDERMLGGTAPSPQKRATPAKPTTPAKPVAKPPTPKAAPPRRAPVISNSPILRAKEREQFPPYNTLQGMPMLLVTSGSFRRGSDRPGAMPNEQPVTPTGISAFYLSRWPITNALYEQFDPAHRAMRAPGAGDHHPAVFVSADDATRFCEWLSHHERRQYRLPTEAEWEYAARGTDDRIFPWGDTLDRGDYANFADVNTRFPWANPSIDDGFAESNPIGRFPRGASPFGMEEMAGNVWEWCLDGVATYPGREQTNPRGPLEGTHRVVRGGSWKSRPGNLRVSARAFQPPGTTAHDIGFRILCVPGA